MGDSTTFFGAFPPISTEEWEAQITNDLQGGDYKKKLRWQTGEGIQPLPFYRRENLPQLDSSSPLAETVHHPWEVREKISGSSIADANNTARKALKRGADALQLSLSIHETELQIQGLPLREQTNFSALMKSIPLDKTPLHIDSGPLSPAILAMLWREANRQSLPGKAIQGTVNYDPCAIRLQHGKLSASDEITEAVYKLGLFCQQNLPKMRPFGIDARLYHNSGASIVQQLGFALASATEMLAILTDRNVAIDRAAQMLHFNVATGSKYFLEVAKIRALRLLWQNMLEAFEGTPQQTPAYIHAETSRWNKTVYEPYTNMLRTSTEGMSAVIGGCDALTVRPFNGHFQQADDFSQRIARNSQTIMREEAQLHRVQDPGAGSYYIEQLTHDLAREAWQLFQKLEERGGMIRAIDEGFVQSAIQQSRREKDQAIAMRQRLFVGTNQYPNPDEKHTQGSSQPDEATTLTTTGRDIESDSLYSIEQLGQFFADGATLGDVAEEILSADSKITRLQPYRGAQAFEELRRATEQHEMTPTVLNLPIGDPKTCKVRSAFSNNLFGCLGYEINDPIGFSDVQDAVDAIQENQPEVAVLCSSDKEYEELVPKLCAQLTNLEDRPLLVLAGYPEQQVENYRKAGIDLFIYSGCNVLETLKEVQQKLYIIKSSQ
jgi:methylmalonyl-CoA mutase